MADACVVGVPDEYSGEVPFAFIVPEERAANRLSKNPKEAEKLKASISKVDDLIWLSMPESDLNCSMFRMRRCSTSG